MQFLSATDIDRKKADCHQQTSPWFRNRDGNVVDPDIHVGWTKEETRNGTGDLEFIDSSQHRGK